MELDSGTETLQTRPDLDPPVVSCHSAIFSIVDNQLSLLLAERNEGPFRFQWELPGTTPANIEDLPDAALRASTPPLTPSGTSELQQLGAYGVPDRDPRHRSIAIVYWGVTHRHNINTSSSGPQLVPTESWFSDEFRFAFDHREIAIDALVALQRSLNTTSLATRLCAPRFSISELQHVYEVVFEAKIPAGNFYRKIQNTPGFVTPTEEPVIDQPRKGRPAQYFETDTIVNVSPPFQFDTRPTR